MTAAGSSSSDWEPISRLVGNISPALAALLVLSCVGLVRAPQPMTPEQAAAGAWQRLADQRSFRFTLSLHTDMPMPIEVRFKGIRERADRELWSGYMRRRTEMTRVELRAEGAVQYEREPSGWRRTIRGVETRVLEQGEGALRSSRLEFVGIQRRRYVYRFRPDLPILDPTRSKKLSGLMELDPGSGLPVRLYCGDSAGTAEWELLLGRFNHGGTVAIPFTPAMVVDACPSRRLSGNALAGARATLGRRLARLGWEHRLSRTRRGLRLLLGQVKTRRQVELLFSRGNVEVWQGRWIAGGENADGAVEVGGDASRRVVLQRLLAADERLELQVGATTPLAATLEAYGVVSDSPQPAILVLNKTALSAAHSNSDGRQVFQDLGSEDDVRVIVALAGSGPLPVDFAVVFKP